MAVERINYQAGNAACNGALIYDENVKGRRPLLLISPNWLGMSGDAIKRAADMAGAKYVAFIADMYGGGKVANGPPEAAPLANGLRADAPERRRRIAAALDALARRKRQTRHRRSQSPGCSRLLLWRRQRTRARTHGRRRDRPSFACTAICSPHCRQRPATSRPQSASCMALRRSCGAEKRPRHVRSRNGSLWRQMADAGRSAACCIRSARANPTCRASPVSIPAPRDSVTP